MWKIALYLFFGFFVSAALSETIGFAHIAWNSGWTYLWLIGWPIMATIKLGIWVGVVVAVVGGALVSFKYLRESFIPDSMGTKKWPKNKKNGRDHYGIDT